MQTCGKCHAQSNDMLQNCSRCGADLRTHSVLAMARASMQANERVSMIRLAVSNDCCPACAAVQGAYAKQQVPVLPVQGCSHGLGCRCTYEPVLTEVYP